MYHITCLGESSDVVGFPISVKIIITLHKNEYNSQQLLKMMKKSA